MPILPNGALQVRPGTEMVDLWAIAADGDALYRDNVRVSCPEGTNWVHVPADSPFQSISIGPGGKVWAVGKDGSAFLRHGVTDAAPTGNTPCVLFQEYTA